MKLVLITVVRGERRRDLAVRDDVPIADLLTPLAEELARDVGDDRHNQRCGSRVSPLALAPVCGARLPAERSLAACGVGHGAVLVLLDGPAGTECAGPLADDAAQSG